MKLHTNVYLSILNTNDQGLLCDSQNIHICKPYLFLHIYEPLSILCLLAIFVFFCKCLWSFYWKSWTFYIWQPYLFSDISDNFCIPCLADILLFIYAFNFWNYIHVYIYKLYYCLVNVKWQLEMFLFATYIVMW